METRLTFGEWLSDRIYAADLDQTRLAAALDIKPSAVSNWVGGSNFPGRKAIPELVRLLDVDRDELERRIREERERRGGVSAPKGVRSAAKRREVRFLARVPASHLAWVAMESERRMIELPESWLQDVRSPAVAVEVSGNCLTSRGIFDGDLVICEPVPDSQSVPQNKVVLVRVDDEYSLKVWVWVSADTAELRDGNGAVIATLSDFNDIEVIGVARKRYGDVL